MRRLVMIACLITAMNLGGCASQQFGTFKDVYQNESSKEDVRGVLGKPANTIIESDREIWQYTFTQITKVEGGEEQTVVDVAFTFQDGMVSSYTVSPSKKFVKTKDRPSRDDRQPPGQVKNDKEFLKEFDRNHDGKVTRKEFTGSDRRFNKLDRNRNGVIEGSEIPPNKKNKGRGR